MLRSNVWKWTAVAVVVGGVGIFSTGTITAQETATQPRVAAAQDLPAAADIIKKYLTAIGGKEALDAIKNVTAKGTMAIPQAGLTGDLEMYQADGKMLMIIEIPGIGSQTVGFDGSVAWQDSDLMGPQLLEGGMLEDMKFQAKIDGYSGALEYFDSMKTVALTDFNGEESYKVVAKKKGTSDKTLFFSKESGLLVGSEGAQESPFGEIEITTVVSDYKKVGGIMMSHKAELKMSNGMTQQLAMTEVKVNQEIPANKFVLPDSIKRLVK